MIFSDRHLTRSYKVAVKRMGEKIIVDRFSSSYKRLTNYLTPKQSLSAGHPVVSPSGEKTTVETHMMPIFDSNYFLTGLDMRQNLLS